MKPATYWTAASVGVIVVLAAFLAVSIRARNDSDESVRFLRQNADNALSYQLSIVASSFGKDLAEDEEGYHQCIAALSAAAAISPLTTYEAQNDLIDGVLYGFVGMLNNPSNKETVLRHAPELRTIFLKLHVNPADAAATQRLSELSSTLRS
ncbi:hypothetical protein GXP70_03555 [Paenibacillus lycopersici]|uniref:Uncharacterized protein n=1 Tax=Paenibacillus lycopersici TaxID=2704462 RepID=A0A6C0FQG7_9BACL|nr:hypothetical protein [Paenibacillus lycopersici]QHT59127.1 hypothetical protein GXP70_03555 [Paenibacillus lycopersici]